MSHFNQENKKILHYNPNKEWSHFIENEKYTVFRRKLPSGLYEYRGKSGYALILKFSVLIQGLTGMI